MIQYVKMILLAVVVFWAASAAAMQSTDHSGHKMSAEKEDHSSMSHGDGGHSGHFKHAEMVDGIHATFQVMSLASMKMKDPEGKTHHIMVSFSQNKKTMKDVAGDIKTLSPSGKEQIGELKHLGGGMYAANFVFDEVGEWKVTCDFQDGANSHVLKFNYPHE